MGISFTGPAELTLGRSLAIQWRLQSGKRLSGLAHRHTESRSRNRLRILGESQGRFRRRRYDELCSKVGVTGPDRSGNGRIGYIAA